MSSRLLPWQLVAALASLAIPAEVSAAQTQTVAAQVALLSPLSVLKQGDLDFGTLIVSGSGTAVIDPVSGVLTTTGGATKSGSGAHPALFTGTGSKNSVVHIRLPQNPITVTRVGGTETMTVSNWTLDGPMNRKIPPGSIFDFTVGATLTVNANQAPGTYNGTFSITVQYP
jgi:hypothetical protein